MKGISKSEEANIASDDLLNFLDDMMPHTKLSSESPRDSFHLWVFWSQEEECHHHASTDSNPGNQANHWSIIRNQIKTALSSFNTCGNEDLLIQFWAPTLMIGDRHRLATSHQPFALKTMNVKLTQYRKHCLSYNFVVPDVNAEGEEDHTLVDGLPARVFRNQLPEFSPDLSYYSVKEYPQRDLGIDCGIPQTLAFPVFEPSQQRCVGVLEILLIGDFSPIFDFYVDMTKSELKKAGLLTTNTWQMCYQIRKGIHHAAEEFKEALQQVCATHNLPLACVWARCKHNSLDSRYTDCDANFRGELVVSIPGMGIYDDKRSYDYCRASLSLPLRLGQGPVSKAFLSGKPYFCQDVTQLSISENPLAHLARKLGFAGCFAVGVQSSTTRDHAYVIEFFLHRDRAYSGDPQNLMSTILAILSQHFKSFEVAVGDMGNELFTEVYKLGESSVEAPTVKGENVICAEQSNTAFTSYKIISASETSESGCAETGDAPSIDTTEYTLKSTGRKPNIYATPTCKRSKPESSFSVDRSAPGEDFDGGFKDHHSSDLDLKKRKVLPTQTSHRGACSDNIEIKVANGWKKNGEKLGAMFPRNIYGGTYDIPQCFLATKTIERDCEYPLLFDMTYGGRDTSYLTRTVSVPTPLSPGKQGKDQNHHHTNHQEKELDEILSNLQENHSAVETGVLVKSSTASSDFLTLFGQMMSVEESQNPIPDECRGDSSFSNAPLSEVSAAPVVDEEMVTIKVKYEEDIIIISLLPSSGLANLVETVSERLKVLKEKTFYIKNLDDSGEWNSVATDDDLQECLAKSRSGAKKMIRMLIQLKESVQHQ